MAYVRARLLGLRDTSCSNTKKGDICSGTADVYQVIDTCPAYESRAIHPAVPKKSNSTLCQCSDFPRPQKKPPNHPPIQSVGHFFSLASEKHYRKELPFFFGLTTFAVPQPINPAPPSLPSMPSIALYSDGLLHAKKTSEPSPNLTTQPMRAVSPMQTAAHQYGLTSRSFFFFTMLAYGSPYFTVTFHSVPKF